MMFLTANNDRARHARATLLVGLLGLAGAAYSAEPATPIKVNISVSAYPATSPSVPYVVGTRLGIFKRNGIEIGRISGSGGGGQTVRNVISGELAFGDVATPAAVTAFMKGESVVIIGGAVQSVSEIYYVAREGSPIKAIQDLRGKTVGYTSPGSVTQAVLELALNAAGMKSSDLNARSMGGINQVLTGLQAGALDAGANLEPLFSKNPEPFQIVFRVGQYVPAFEQTVLITRREFLKENPEAVRRFLKGYAESIDYIRNNPDAAAKAWAEESELDPKVARAAIDVYLKAEQWNVGFKPAALETVEQSMRMLNTVKANETVPWKDVIVQDFLPTGVSRIDLGSISKR